MVSEAQSTKSAQTSVNIVTKSDHEGQSRLKPVTMPGVEHIVKVLVEAEEEGRCDSLNSGRQKELRWESANLEQNVNEVETSSESGLSSQGESQVGLSDQRVKQSVRKQGHLSQKLKNEIIQKSKKSPAHESPLEVIYPPYIRVERTSRKNVQNLYRRSQKVKDNRSITEELVRQRADFGNP